MHGREMGAVVEAPFELGAGARDVLAAHGTIGADDGALDVAEQRLHGEPLARFLRLPHVLALPALLGRQPGVHLLDVLHLHTAGAGRAEIARLLRRLQGELQLGRAAIEPSPANELAMPASSTMRPLSMTSMRLAHCTVASRCAMTSVVRFSITRSRALLHGHLALGIERKLL
jgi:hypothetical protein